MGPLLTCGASGRPDWTTKSTPRVAVPGPVTHITVTGSAAGLSSATVNVTVVVPESPSTTTASATDTRDLSGSYSSNPESSVRTRTSSNAAVPVVSTP